MSDVPFHLTRMGHTYYGHTLPELVKQIARLTDALERLADAEPERADEPETPDKEKP